MKSYGAYTLKPGMTPWEVVVAYFIIASIIAAIIIKKSNERMTTIDFVYAAIGGAVVAVADHIVGDLIYLPSPIYPIINPPVWLRIVAFFVTVGLIRKVGSGMFAMGIFDITGDLIHFGFGGEPLWLIEDVLTYGLMADITIFLTNRKIFGIGAGKLSALLAILEGAILGFFFSFVHPFFTYGFFAPFIFGFAPNAQRILYLFVTYVPGDIIIGTISALFANRVAKVVQY